MKKKLLGVKLRFDSLKWNNLSVIMVAGKKLKLRTGYARVLFKNNVYSVSTTGKNFLLILLGQNFILRIKNN